MEKMSNNDSFREKIIGNVLIRLEILPKLST